MSLASRSSPGDAGTQMRPSLRSDSLMRIVLDCHFELTGSVVGWNWMNDGEAISAPRWTARQAAEALEFFASVEK